MLVRKDVQSPTVLSDNQLAHRHLRADGNKIALTVDGVVVDTANGNTGSITNNVPLTIGGKLDCDQIVTTCDYYTGDIDYVKIDDSAAQTGAAATPLRRRSARRRR